MAKKGLNPNDFGVNCLYNGEHKDIFGRIIECECDNCDYAIGCIIPEDYELSLIYKYSEELEKKRCLMVHSKIFKKFQKSIFPALSFGYWIRFLSIIFFRVFIFKGISK